LPVCSDSKVKSEEGHFWRMPPRELHGAACQAAHWLRELDRDLAGSVTFHP
jgi:hypothetical protein